ncbi:hypothetical protein F5X68DRAFT_127106 [Plectosphaerella plurivora]|uniref:Uncharacterized protein n=1 Tax=Plectosphaerella plurivora TaxID=936078 RepID=A0A9P9AF52_9PEZI|nr:hypothetical protein F5X68DRAFT_127106 [Plectosphaerella plurivora]
MSSPPASPGVSFAGKEKVRDIPHQHQRHHQRKPSSRPPPPPVKRWVHLPANNVAWVLDLVQKLSAVDGKTEAECARIMRFVRDTFLEMRFSAPYRKPHFRREMVGADAGGGPGGLGPVNGNMFSLVLPVIDVDMDEGSRLQLQAAGGSANVPARELLRAGTEERHRSLRAMPTNLQHYLFPYLKHMGAMLELRRCFNKSELHVPRTLDQSYHESLSREEVRQRSESQVLYRYLRRLEEALASTNSDVAGAKDEGNNQKQASGQASTANPFAHRELLSDVSSEKQKRTDGTKEQLMRMAGRQDVASSVRARVQRELRGGEPARRRQVLMVSQLWMWRLDEHNVVTCYPERWDDKNAKTLLNDMKHKMLGLKPAAGAAAAVDMSAVTARVLSAATAFGDEEFHFQFAGPRSYANAFGGSVARVSDEAMKRYTRFEEGIRGMRTSRTVLGDLRAEIALLQEIDDVGEEIIMVQRVLGEQARVAAEFEAAVGGETNAVVVMPGSGAPPAVGFFERLGMDAARVRLSITTLLDLRQREANIEEALSANEQSKILFIFTGATVVFAPLSWIMGVFEVNIDGLPSPMSPGFAAAASLGSLFATIIVIWLSLQVFELVTRGSASSRRGKLDTLLRKPDPKKPTTSPTPQLSPQRSSAATSSAGHRKLRKRYIFLGRDGRRRLDEHAAAGAV